MNFQLIPSIPISSVTYTQLESLKLSNDLDTSVYYLITDRDIYVMAYDSSTIQPNALRHMLCANHSVGINPPTGTVGKVWCPYYGITYNIDDKVVWGGKVWKNLTGNVGSRVDILTLDSTNWVEVPFVEGVDYIKTYFDIVYDFDNDLVVTQVDSYNNQVGPVSLINVINLGYNPCDVTDWLAFNYTYTANSNQYPLGCINLYSKIDLGTKVINNYDSTINEVFLSPMFDENEISNNIGTQSPKLISNLFGINLIIGNDIHKIVNNGVADSLATSLVFEFNKGNFVDISDNTDIGVIDNNTGDLKIVGCTNISNISHTDEIKLENVQNIQIIDNSSNFSITNLDYSGNSIHSLINLGIAIELTVPFTLNNITISSNKTIEQYLEFIAPFNVNVKKYLSGVILPDTRIVEAYITSSGLKTTPTSGVYPTMEFGVETTGSTLVYMAPVLNSVLNTTPQHLTTITNTLSVGKQFYVKQAVNTTTGNTAKVKVLLKLVQL